MNLVFQSRELQHELDYFEDTYLLVLIWTWISNYCFKDFQVHNWILDKTGSLKEWSFLQKLKGHLAKYTVLQFNAHATMQILLWRGFDREPLKLQKQMIPHFLALDVGVKICQAQLIWMP